LARVRVEGADLVALLERLDGDGGAVAEEDVGASDEAAFLGSVTRQGLLNKVSVLLGYIASPLSEFRGANRVALSESGLGAARGED